MGRWGTTYEIALARVCVLRLDVLLIQGPWWPGYTESYPYFDCHIPYSDPNIRPRAVSYTKRDPKGIFATQKFPTLLMADYFWVTVNDTTFLNVYKAPHDLIAVQSLLNWTPDRRSIAVGDLHSVHWAWQPGISNSYGQGEEIEKWAEENNLSCLIVGEPTHRVGNALDLAWTNISSTCAWLEHEDCMTSDHLPICGSVICSLTPKTSPEGPLRVI